MGLKVFATRLTAVRSLSHAGRMRYTILVVKAMFVVDTAESALGSG